MATVLLVDDEYETLCALQVAFEAVGHRVLLAGNEKDALHAASRFLPDLVATDWNAALGSKVRLVQRVRASLVLAGQA